MASIHHDAHSLRLAAIQRYLNARDRINDRYKRRTLGIVLLVLATATIVCAVFAIRNHSS